MTVYPKPAGDRIAGREGTTRDSALLSVREVADLLGCSARHVYRMTDAGRMPPPVRLGSLVRWPRATLEEWVANGCPSVHGSGR